MSDHEINNNDITKLAADIAGHARDLQALTISAIGRQAALRTLSELVDYIVVLRRVQDLPLQVHTSVEALTRLVASKAQEMVEQGDEFFGQLQQWIEDVNAAVALASAITRKQSGTASDIVSKLR
jgi:hypothetical protein